ncbi:hypothetical protein Tco_0897798 [Tanacetum coccineum]
MLYLVPVLLVSSIGIILCVILWSTYVSGQGFRLEKKFILVLEEDVTSPYIPRICYSIRGMKGLMCVDLTGSSPLTQTGMVDFVPGCAVIDAAHRKRVKYEAKRADIGYGFLPFLFSSLGDLDKDAVTLLKRIRKFSVTQDIGARTAVHIFNRISFAIAKGVGAQLVSRLPNAVTLLKRIRKFSIIQDIGALAAIHIFNRISFAIAKGDEGLDVCVDLTWSSPLTHTGMVDFVPGHAMIEATHCKRVKHEAKCADIGYGFPPISLSSLRELEKDAMTLLKRIRKFFVTQDIGARAAVHIFDRINFVIAKGVEAQLVSRLPTNFFVNINYF